MSVAIGGLLKHIPCPNGDACTTYRCLFRHAKDEISLAPASPTPHPRLSDQTSPTLPPTPEARPNNTTVHDEARPQGSVIPDDRHGQNPRKRDLTSALGSSDDRGPTTKMKRGLASGSDSQDALHIAARARARPRMLPRTVERRDKSVEAPSSEKTATPLRRVISAPPKPTNLPNKAVPRPVEVLNPRHVKSAPARHDIRLRLLKLLHKSFKRLNDALHTSGTDEEKTELVLTDQALITLALDVEESLAQSKSTAVYADVVKHRVVSYMNMKVDQWKKERLEAVEKEKEKEKEEQEQAEESRGRQRDSAVLVDAELPKPVQKPPTPASPPNLLSPAEEMEVLRRDYLTPIDKLAAYGYVPAIPSDEDIKEARAADAFAAGWEMCSECDTRFQVFPGRREDDGALTSRGPCRYHPSRYDRNRDSYQCCGSSFGDAGCEVSESHHFKVRDAKRLAALWNFVPTPPNPNAPADRAVCFDCEMGYTVHGMEVIRLTATDWRSGAVLLDVLVRPWGAIIDLNSRYSGVWPKDMAEAKPYSAPAEKAADSIADASATKNGSSNAGEPSQSQNGSSGTNDTNGNGDADQRPPLQIVSSPMAARDLLFSLISPETPLIGHGLENDLNVMRIVHPTLVDTVLLFKHPRGLPSRYSLKHLTLEHLGRHIQQTTKGHDSAEDARAAGDLVRYKIQHKLI